MACTLGRASLPSPDFIRQDSGGRLRVGHRDGYAFTGTDGLAMAQQISGYPNEFEEQVIFTYDGAPQLNGWYFVENTNVDWVKLAAGLFAWEASLIPIPNPIFEVSILGINRPTAHSITEWSWAGAPTGSVKWWPDGTAATLMSSHNDDLFIAPSGSKTALYDNTLMLLIPIVNAYAVGYCSIEKEYSTGVYASVVGDVIDDVVPSDWRLSSPRIRISQASDTTSTFTVEVFNTSTVTWQSKTFKLGRGGASATSIGAPYAFAILHNSPWVCSIRLYFNDANFIGYCDLTVRLGSWVIEGNLVALDGSTYQLGVFRATNEAGTGVTGGIDAAADDADSNKYQLRSPSAVSTETTIGGIYLTGAAESFPFAIATDRWAGNGTTGPTTSGLYFAAMEQTAEVVKG